MANIILKPDISVQQRLDIMGNDARYDIADGDSAAGDFGAGGNPYDKAARGISNIKSSPPPPKVPKLFLSNDCVFNCAYCGCRNRRS